jgi:hypothetical protein
MTPCFLPLPLTPAERTANIDDKTSSMDTSWDGVNVTALLFAVAISPGTSKSDAKMSDPTRAGQAADDDRRSQASFWCEIKEFPWQRIMRGRFLVTVSRGPDVVVYPAKKHSDFQSRLDDVF